MFKLAGKGCVSDGLCNGVWRLFVVFIAASFFAGMFFFLPPWNVYAMDRYRVFSIIILVGVSLTFFLCGGFRSSLSVIVGWFFGLSLLVFAFFGFFSALLSYFPRYALLEWAYFMGSCLLGVGVYRFVQDNKSLALENLFDSILFSVCVYSVLYLAWYFTQISCQKMFCVQLFLPGFNNPRTFDALFLPVMLLYPFSCKDLPRRFFVRAAYWISGAVWFSLLYVSNARTSYLAILLVCLLVYVLSPQVAVPWLRRLVFFLILGAVAFVSLHGLWPLLRGASFEIVPASSLFATDSVHSRVELWRRGVSIFLENPILGSGPLHYAYWGDIPHIREGAGPHNLIIQLLSEWGIFCTVLFIANSLFLFCKAFVYFRKKLSVQADSAVSIDLAVFVAWASLMIAAQTSGTNLLMLAGLSGMLAGLVIQKNVAGKANVGIVGNIGIMVVTLAIVVLLLNGLYPEIACRKEEAAAYVKAYPDEKRPVPRFWSQGKIAFSDTYLAQCYKDAERLFVEKGWRSEPMSESSSP